MKNISENQLDELLQAAQDRTPDEAEYASTEKFKAEFFRRANAQKARSSAWIYRVLIPAAAAFLVCGGVLFYQFGGEAEVTPEIVAAHPVNAHRKNSGKVRIAADGSAGVRGRPVPRKMKMANADAKGAPCSEMCMAPKCEENIGHLPPQPQWNTEEYKSYRERGFTATATMPLSTFGADVDTAGYTNVRRFLMQFNRLPDKDAVRTDEFLNYFHYDYGKVEGDADFRVNFESMDAPWAPERKLLLVGVQARDMDLENLPPSNFVFLIDNSGSMYEEMPLVIEAMETLAERLRENDRISVVTYGGGVKVLIDGGSGAERAKVRDEIRKLRAGGYTPGGAGILEAYKLAHRHFIKGGNNRIVLITDGDFNVGTSSESELVKMVEKERKSAIYLSVFGVGYGNYKDSKMKMLANHGNGNYSYLDNVREARRVMTNELTGKMFTIAKDVKFQLEFNPAQVAAYRLVGYEFRELAARDFNDDDKDSGEIGLGHQLTAVYELIMANAPDAVKAKYLGKVDALKYQTPGKVASSGDILTFKLRYQKPEGNDPSRLQVLELKSLPEATDNIRWASAVTEFCLLLRDSEYKGNAGYTEILARAKKCLGDDPEGKRAEFLTPVQAAKDLQK